MVDMAPAATTSRTAQRAAGPSTAASSSSSSLSAPPKTKSKSKSKCPHHSSSSSSSSTTQPEAAIPMGRLLASTEKKVRDGAVRSLARYLATEGAEALLQQRGEMAKLWKGIFYCFWMSDKPLVQQALAQELSDLVLAIPGSSRVPAPAIPGYPSSFSGAAASSSATPVGPISDRSRGGLALFEGFLDAVIRDWSALDKWRLDKFYLLIRRFLNAALRLLASEGWDENVVEQFNRILLKERGPLCPNDPKVPDSITYHLTDIYLAELEKAAAWAAEQQSDGDAEGAEDDAASIEADVEQGSKKKRKTTAETSISTKGPKASPQSPAQVPVLNLVKPFLSTASTCFSRTVYEKIQSNVILRLVDQCQAASEASEPLDEDSSDFAAVFTSISSTTSPRKLRNLVYKEIFAVASAPDANPAMRSRLYAMWKEEKERREEDDEGEEEEEDDE